MIYLSKPRLLTSNCCTNTRLEGLPSFPSSSQCSCVPFRLLLVVQSLLHCFDFNLEYSSSLPLKFPDDSMSILCRPTNVFPKSGVQE